LASRSCAICALCCATSVANDGNSLLFDVFDDDVFEDVFDVDDVDDVVDVDARTEVLLGPMARAKSSASATKFDIDVQLFLDFKKIQMFFFLLRSLNLDQMPNVFTLKIQM
jgi:hypothetical protein